VAATPHGRTKYRAHLPSGEEDRVFRAGAGIESVRAALVEVLGADGQRLEEIKYVDEDGDTVAVLADTDIADAQRVWVLATCVPLYITLAAQPIPGFESATSEPQPEPSLRSGDYETALDDYVQTRVLCEGPVCTVSAGHRLGQPHQEVVLKLFRRQYATCPGHVEDFRKEVEVLRTVRSPRTVLFIGAATRPPDLAIVMEKMHMSLFDYLHKCSQPPKPLANPKHLKRCMQILHDTAAGLQALLSYDIIHRDLKSPNVLLDTQGRAKVADFGLSRFLRRKKYVSTLNCDAGTPAWMAPELLRAEPGSVTPAADVWSYGVVLWEVFSGRVPWGDKLLPQLICGVAFSDWSLSLPETMRSSHPAMVELFSHCMDRDATKRLSIGEVVTQMQTNLDGCCARTS
jgi:serine/threonine protein kinase